MRLGGCIGAFWRAEAAAQEPLGLFGCRILGCSRRTRLLKETRMSKENRMLPGARNGYRYGNASRPDTDSNSDGDGHRHRYA